MSSQGGVIGSRWGDLVLRYVQGDRAGEGGGGR